MRLASQVAALCLAAIATSASARSFSVADLLAAEEFGQMAFTPDGKSLVFERHTPFKDAGPFEYDTYPSLRRSRLYVVDVESQATPRLLIAAGPGEGHTAGPISPGGGAMVVLRLKGREWEAGVVTLATGKVRWLGVTPELAQLGQTIAWRSDDQLVIAARRSIPLRLRSGWRARETLLAQWSAAARGATAISEVASSSAYAGVRRPDDEGELLLVDLPSGRRQVLAHGDIYDLAISPDGRQVAAMTNLEAIAPTPSPRTVATANRRRNLILADLQTGAVATPCADCDLSPNLIYWSEDSRQILVHGRRSGEAQAKLLRLATTGAAALHTGDLQFVLGQTSEGHVIPPASWMGATPIALLKPLGGRADWYALGDAAPVNLTEHLPVAPSPRLLAQEPASFVVASAGALWRVGPRRAEPVATHASPLSPQGFSLSSRERQTAPAPVGWFFSTKDGSQRAHSTAGDIAPPFAGQAWSTALTAGAYARVSSNDQGGLDLVLAAPRPRVVMSLNPQFSDVEFATVRIIKDRAPDGAALEHYLLLPRHPRAERPPLIVVPYPGLLAYPPPRPYGGGTGRFPANAELMASAGYAVLVPALPRPAGGEPAAGLADQILAAVDLVAARVGGFDASRPILWGQSFGGYTALMAAAQSERFCAVIASAAVTNLASARGVFDPHAEARPQDGISAYMVGWSEAGQAGLAASPWEASELFVRNSPVFQADKITAPVLLIHGDIDFVRLGQAQEMFSALARQAKDVTLITAYGEGHIVSTPGNLKAVYDRAFAWLERRTQSASP
ncbi:MAG: hypothetical protein C0481_03915 [Phenylobacterium sp.]|uniref:alpha/beta hydrolase family protein n=1 Tax=Phenylobacterium sp. TaxID=1871053 RepID=UPI0025E0D581|nr:prolyl oligopeptidase family serine peptidase [Phenylobacterium sp.]MBA4010990.1 hypothetical protein [Phenylobacterium sp.]